MKVRVEWSEYVIVQFRLIALIRHVNAKSWTTNALSISGPNLSTWPAQYCQLVNFAIYANIKK